MPVRGYFIDLDITQSIRNFPFIHISEIHLKLHYEECSSFRHDPDTDSHFANIKAFPDVSTFDKTKYGVTDVMILAS
jgi:hypothetical protein